MDSSHFFADVPPDERAQIMDEACERGGVNDFFDLPPEDRGAAYDRADENYN